MKKQYMKPAMQVEELQQCTQLLQASNNYGMNPNIVTDEEVDEGW